MIRFETKGRCREGEIWGGRSDFEEGYMQDLSAKLGTDRENRADWPELRLMTSTGLPANGDPGNEQAREPKGDEVGITVIMNRHFTGNFDVKPKIYVSLDRVRNSPGSCFVMGGQGV